MTGHKLTDWLPTTKKEVELRRWDSIDVILFTGDAYVDHPSFGAAVIGRWIEHLGLRVAIVPQPNWRDDLRDFRKLGKPCLFFAISAGAMDSMVNKYTAAKRLRSEDAYTPDARTDLRPEYPTTVYSSILKQLFPDTPVVAGGIEASQRRLAHYDYWQDKLLPSIAVASRADILVYGCGEKPITEIVQKLRDGVRAEDLTGIRQTVTVRKNYETQEGDIILASYEDCLKNRINQAANFRYIEEASNRMTADSRIIQKTGDSYVIVNPPFGPVTTAELDASFDLPYTRLPHPRYHGKRIPAYETIRHSITLHRGCFGGCAFCTISAHQGKFVVSRSRESILKEALAVTEMPDFKGYISDLGGPSANMYGMKGRNLSICEKCSKPSCIFPSVCRNLNADHRPLTEIYRAVDKIKGIAGSFIGSGVRYDLLVNRYGDEALNRAASEYTRELITRHVSGRLKVAPEHSCRATLECMRKPDFDAYRRFKQIFDRINAEYHLRRQLIPYFISSHPACTETDMAGLAVITRELNFRPEQVQDFTPTPMTLSTEIFYTGINPYTLQKVYTARTAEEKLRQRQYFFWYDKAYKDGIIKSLHRLGRADLIRKLFPY
jgi:uncharacterized radical SAM protein YgiQ